jgi:uncharacterized protein YceH (UPF0502 family)
MSAVASNRRTQDRSVQTPDHPRASQTSELDARVARLEYIVAELKAQLERLAKQTVALQAHLDHLEARR